MRQSDSAAPRVLLSGLRLEAPALEQSARLVCRRGPHRLRLRVRTLPGLNGPRACDRPAVRLDPKRAAHDGHTPAPCGAAHGDDHE